MITENSKAKKEYFEEYVKENDVILINFTETWMNETIKEDANINEFQCFRVDRKDVSRGGAAIYIRDQLEAKIISKINAGKCEMLAINIEHLNTINIVIYRPPDTTLNTFSSIIKELQSILESIKPPDPNIIITGDFNFPFIKWIREPCNGCRWEYVASASASRDEKSQFINLILLLDKYNVIQSIEEPTRGNNTLDLVFTNNIDMFIDIGVTESLLSDHNIIEISTSYKVNQKVEYERTKHKGETDLWRLNYRNENISWSNINEKIKEIPWKKLFEGKDVKKCSEIFISIIIYICFKFIPPKKPPTGSKIPRERKKLLNRLKMLKRSKHRKHKNNVKKKEVEKKIEETERNLIEHKRRERFDKEMKIIENIKSNPKRLFDYVKKSKNKDNRVGPFKNGNEYIYDAKTICSILTEQYNSQFSKKTDNENEIKMFENILEDDLVDINIKETDIRDAIDKLETNSAQGPDGVPAILLIKTRDTITVPLKLILRKSLDESTIPDIYKLAYVTPIYKGGSKFKPENYRPVSLTSHIVKVFERVLKVKIIQHLTEHKLLNQGQHGFVPGRSTQSQLLQHYCDIYEALAEGVRIDTVYLDFAKAFDKVNHKILLQKVIKHKIKGKIGRWILEFLCNRKYKVVANGETSELHEVISGVPQGTVLGAILFVIMISDIDEEVEKCIVRSFADDTKTSLKIKTAVDKEILQRDLEKIYKWAKDNLMEFNESKFEQMTHGEYNNVPIASYKTPSQNIIMPSNKVKDLGIITSDNLGFKEHIDGVVTSSKIMIGLLLRTFSMRQEIPMMRLFNTYIRSKLEYCCLVWSPSQQNEINKLERIQKNFTSKISGMENLNYHQRLRKMNLYSLERRRERYMIINAWQQIEGISENILGLKARTIGRSRRIVSTVIPFGIKGKKIKEKNRTLIHYSTARKMERLFNILPPNIRKITGKTTETFKKHIDKWLISIPDTPKIDGYGITVAAESNSILDQVRYAKSN